MVFLGGFHGTPLCTNGSAGYLMQLSVKPGHMHVLNGWDACALYYRRVETTSGLNDPQRRGSRIKKKVNVQ